jgi:hypothetical protein
VTPNHHRSFIIIMKALPHHAQLGNQLTWATSSCDVLLYTDCMGQGYPWFFPHPSGPVIIIIIIITYPPRELESCVMITMRSQQTRKCQNDVILC